MPQSRGMDDDALYREALGWNVEVADSFLKASRGDLPTK